MKPTPPIPIKNIHWFKANNPDAFYWLEKSIVNKKGIVQENQVKKKK